MLRVSIKKEFLQVTQALASVSFCMATHRHRHSWGPRSLCHTIFVYVPSSLLISRAEMRIIAPPTPKCLKDWVLLLLWKKKRTKSYSDFPWGIASILVWLHDRTKASRLRASKTMAHDFEEVHRPIQKELLLPRGLPAASATINTPQKLGRVTEANK